MIRLTTLLILLVQTLVNSGCGPPSPTPNVILISLDTLRADHLGTYGYSRPTSPFLDQLAQQGTLFETAIVQLPGTLPSHMCMFTGLYPNEHGVFPPNGALASEIPTLPEILQKAGYATAGFTEGGYVAGHFGFDRGFDHFDDRVPKLANDIEVVFSRGLSFLQSQQEATKPFFLFLHSYAIHDPYFPPLPYTTLYLDGMGTAGSFEDQYGFFHYSEFPLLTPTRAKEHHEIFTKTRDLVKRGLPPGADLPTGSLLALKNRGEPRNIPPQTLAYYTALYDASINYVDDVMRAFFGSLEVLGVLENTVIIITSDHGEEFLEHGKLAHEQVYNECLHVPLIILDPASEGGRRIPEIVRTIDLAPTIFDLTRVPPPNPMSGVSLVPLLKNSQSWIAQDAFARDNANTGNSLYTFDQHLFHAVVYQFDKHKGDDWHSRSVHFTSNRNEIVFRAMSFDVPRKVEVLVDGLPHSTLLMTPAWQEFRLSLEGGSKVRSFLLQTPDCLVPADVGDSIDQRCLSFRIEGFPTGKLELFDLTSSPMGTTDIISSDSGRGIEMEERMKNYQLTPVTNKETVTLSPEDIERLKSLGYLQ